MFPSPTDGIRDRLAERLWQPTSHRPHPIRSLRLLRRDPEFPLACFPEPAEHRGGPVGSFAETSARDRGKRSGGFPAATAADRGRFAGGLVFLAASAFPVRSFRRAARQSLTPRRMCRSSPRGDCFAGGGRNAQVNRGRAKRGTRHAGEHRSHSRHRPSKRICVSRRSRGYPPL
jgi:hypothetical protein